MQRDIYAKARRLEDEGRVRLTTETKRASYFEVDGDSGLHYVRLMHDNTFNCTCMWGTLKGATYGSLCSHVVSAILSLTDEQERGMPVPRERDREHALDA